jgi:serine/threonine protein kinase
MYRFFEQSRGVRLDSQAVRSRLPRELSLNLGSDINGDCHAGPSPRPCPTLPLRESGIKQIIQQNVPYVALCLWSKILCTARANTLESVTLVMASSSGIGPYEITAVIGGIGNRVYRARDTRSAREIAIQVFPENFSEQCEGQARAIAKLNHPHICQICDIGPNYLVMELVDGSALRGPLPLDQVLSHAIQICDALDAAHKVGIRHRTLSPQKILVDNAGVKLRDFGLSLSMPGVLLGQQHYMPPEFYLKPLQKFLQEADARSDIFSFGLVLYHMLTGKRPWDDARGPMSLAFKVFREERPWAIPSAPASSLDRVLERCVAKDPESRWQSALEVGVELERIANTRVEV